MKKITPELTPANIAAVMDVLTASLDRVRGLPPEFDLPDEKPLHPGPRHS